MAHGIDDRSVNDIDRRNLNNASLQTTGFCIYYAQHAGLQTKTTSVME